MYIVPFKSAFGCFEGVIVYLSCICVFSVLFGFFQGLIWPFLLMTTWQPWQGLKDLLRALGLWYCESWE